MQSGTLVIRGGAIGDFVVTLPILARLQAAFPAERIALLAPLEPGSLALAGNLAAEVRDVNGRAFSTFLHAAAAPDPALSKWIGGFARVITFLHDPEEILVRRLQSLVPLVRRGIHRPLADGGSATGQLAAALEGMIPDGLAADFSSFHLVLPCDSHDRAEAELGQAPWIALHAGSGSPQKNWPIGWWVALGQELLVARPQLRLALFAGEAETREVDELTRALPRARVRVVAHRPLVEVAALLAACELYLGHDSGISHLAAAVGIPTVLLFGPTDPAVWAPPQKNTRIVRAPDGDLRRLPVATVWSALPG